MKKCLLFLLALVCVPFCAHGESITLRILGGVSDSIIRAYEAENPHVCIILDSRESTFLGLQEALLSGDDIDLFLVTSDGLYKEAIEKGYGADLSVSSYLMQRTATFFPWAQDILMQDSKLYAVPVSLSSSYWTINRSKFQQLALGDYPATYDELFSLAEAWKDGWAESFPEYCLFDCMDGLSGMLRTMLRQYLLVHENQSAPVDFDTPEFRTAIQSALDHPDIYCQNGEQLALIMSYPQYLGTGYNDEDVVESILPPALTASANQAVSASMELLVMNPSSAHQAQVLDFLEFCAAHWDDLLSYQLDAACTQPLRPAEHEVNLARLTQQIAETEKQLTAADADSRPALQDTLALLRQRLASQETRWRFSAEDISIYQRIAAKTILPVRTIYPATGTAAEVFNTLADRLAAGSISLDQFIHAINQRAETMFYEIN